MHKDKQRMYSKILFLIYLILLVWIVLFKMSINFSQLNQIRNVNLTLYFNSPITNEMRLNVLIFIPFGLYLSLIKPEWRCLSKVIPIVAMSIAFETLQYMFKLGISDLTDVLGNTIGGLVGVVLFNIVQRICKNKTYEVLNTIALISMPIVIILIVVIFF